MQIDVGYFYFIKDSFFDIKSDQKCLKPVSNLRRVLDIFEDIIIFEFITS